MCNIVIKDNTIYITDIDTAGVEQLLDDIISSVTSMNMKYSYKYVTQSVVGDTSHV